MYISYEEEKMDLETAGRVGGGGIRIRSDCQQVSAIIVENFPSQGEAERTLTTYL